MVHCDEFDIFSQLVKELGKDIEVIKETPKKTPKETLDKKVIEAANTILIYCQEQSCSNCKLSLICYDYSLHENLNNLIEHYEPSDIEEVDWGFYT